MNETQLIVLNFAISPTATSQEGLATDINSGDNFFLTGVANASEVYTVGSRVEIADTSGPTPIILAVRFVQSVDDLTGTVYVTEIFNADIIAGGVEIFVYGNIVLHPAPRISGQH